MTIYCKTYCNSHKSNHKIKKVDNKLMKSVLSCAKFEIKETTGNAEAKVDTKLIELVLNCGRES